MRYCILSIILLVQLSGYCQKKWPIKILCLDNTSFSIREKPRFFKDTTDIQSTINTILDEWKGKGFIGASVDTFYFLSDTLYLHAYQGAKVSGIRLERGNLTDFEIAKFGLSKYINKNEIIPVRKINGLKEQLINEYENSGYPFAVVRLDSFSLIGQNYVAKIFAEKNVLFVWDTISKDSPTRIRSIFLRNYLGIKPGKPYREQTARKIDARINVLPFAEPIKKSEIEFSNEKAKARIFIKDRRANQFDLLIGLLPGSSGQKVLITGKAMLRLVSVFGLGEEFQVKWEKLQPKTQTLDVQLIYPFMFGLPIGINAKFELYKKDTSFLNLNGDYGIQFQLQANDYIKGAFKNQISIILNADTNYVKANRKLPPNLDLNINQFALEVFLQRLNYRFNPTDGYLLKGSVSFGLKSFKRNNSIAGLYDPIANQSFGTLYDSIKLKSFIMQFHFMLDKFWKIGKRQTIRTMIDGEYQINDRITDNELYRIGGASSLRGFDDRSILTPFYVMANLEYRYLLSKNAFFFAFVNGAMVKEYRNFKDRPFDVPYGFGAGAAIETRIGMFAISYAMGSRQDEKISFRSAKIHFGYINYF